MNLEKLATPSLFESVSVRVRFSFFDEEKAMIANCYSLVLCSTTHHGVQLKKGMNQGGDPFALAEIGIQYQNTHAKSMILSLCQILLLIA